MKKLFFICLLGTLFSCQKDPIPVLPDNTNVRTVNYFPYTLGQEVEFNMSHINTSYPFTNKDYPDYPNTIQYSVQKWKYEIDATVDGKNYAKVADKVRGYLLFRKESGNYYQKSLTTDQEMLYLKDNLKAGDTWETEITNVANNYREKNTFKILFVKNQVTVDGTTYNNVIAVRRDIDRGVGSNLVTVVNYYSADLGEIYSYYEYPFGVTYGHNKFYRKN